MTVNKLVSSDTFSPTDLCSEWENGNFRNKKFVQFKDCYSTWYRGWLHPNLKLKMWLISFEVDWFRLNPVSVWLTTETSSCPCVISHWYKMDPSSQSWCCFRSSLLIWEISEKSCYPLWLRVMCRVPPRWAQTYIFLNILSEHHKYFQLADTFHANLYSQCGWINLLPSNQNLTSVELQ